MSWCASDKLTKQIRVELDQLSRLLQENQGLIDKAKAGVPSKIEISALAMFLHSLYTGAENVFGRIYVDMHGRKITGDAWHKNLLQAMAKETRGISPVISIELCNSLSEFLTFRHVFRQAYTFEIQWEKMKPLVLGSGPVLQRLASEFTVRFNLKDEPGK
jgi:hypothetical protein